MVTAVFDTLKASRTLKAAGVADAQAEAIVTTMAGAFDDAVATKADIAEVKAELKSTATKTELAEVRAELKSMATKTDIAELKADMLKVAIGVAIAVILANATMTIALIRFLP